MSPKKVSAKYSVDRKTKIIRIELKKEHFFYLFVYLCLD